MTDTCYSSELGGFVCTDGRVVRNPVLHGDGWTIAAAAEFREQGLMSIFRPVSLFVNKDYRSVVREFEEILTFHTPLSWSFVEVHGPRRSLHMARELVHVPEYEFLFKPIGKLHPADGWILEEDSDDRKYKQQAGT